MYILPLYVFYSYHLNWILIYQDRSSLGSKASMDTLKLHLHSIVPPKPFFRLFTRPFRRKSAPSSPALPPKTFRSSSEGPSDSVKLLRTLRKQRVILKRRFRKRLDVYVQCRVQTIKKRKKTRVCKCPNGVVSCDLTHGMHAHVSGDEHAGWSILVEAPRELRTGTRFHITLK